MCSCFTEHNKCNLVYPECSRQECTSDCGRQKSNVSLKLKFPCLCIYKPKLHSFSLFAYSTNGVFGCGYSYVIGSYRYGAHTKVQCRIRIKLFTHVFFFFFFFPSIGGGGESKGFLCVFSGKMHWCCSWATGTNIERASQLLCLCVLSIWRTDFPSLKAKTR